MDELRRLISGDRTAYEIVPLGVDCAISHELRGRGLRLSAYPFDWNVTPFDAAVELLHNGFADFLKVEHLVFLPPVERLLFDERGAEVQIHNDFITPVVCRRYGMLFPHDFSRAGLDDLAAVRLKYAERIDRLRTLLQSDREVVFIAHDQALNDWQESQYAAALGRPFHHSVFDREAALVDALRVPYPRLRFRVVELADFIAAYDA